MRATVRTRVLILSDTHSLTSLPFSQRGALTPPYPQADIILHCGDITNTGEIGDLTKFIRMMGFMQAGLKLVIAGNHDLSLDRAHGSNLRDMYAKHCEAKALMKSELARDAGITYLEEGIHFFKLDNGAGLTLYSSPYTPQYEGWGFSYAREIDRFNLPVPMEGEDDPTSGDCSSIPIPNHTSIVMTHGPPRGILDRCRDGTSAGCDHLLKAVSRCRPLLHCFGHIHEGHGATLVGWSDNQAPIEKSPIQFCLYPGQFILPYFSSHNPASESKQKFCIALNVAPQLIGSPNNCTLIS
jgi:hypothetical protein